LLATFITLANEKGVIPSVNLFIGVYFEGIFVLSIVIQLYEMKKMCSLRGHCAMSALKRSENAPGFTKICSVSMNV
jgi:hypothetical protein